MIYPVFAIYAPTFNHASTTLVGIALGIYGLTQASLQLPLSMLSDRIGRKPVITGGLLVFALGSIISALTHNIYCLIIGRALQGSGAIGSTLMAYAADVTSVENRTKAMALLGITIGLSFAFALIFGPLVNAWVHLSGIFWITAVLALSGILIQYFFLPTQQIAFRSNEPLMDGIKKLVFRGELVKLNLSILFLHAILTASFIIVPFLLTHAGISSSGQWKIYLPVLLGAFLVTLPLLVFAEKKNFINDILLFGIFLLGVSIFFLNHTGATKSLVILALFIFFTGFTLLETILPSLISKIAPSQHKGSAMGIYSTCQFLGIFLGGALGGLIRAHYNASFILYGSTILCSFWFIYMCTWRIKKY